MRIAQFLDQKNINVGDEISTFQSNESFDDKIITATIEDVDVDDPKAKASPFIGEDTRKYSIKANVFKSRFSLYIDSSRHPIPEPGDKITVRIYTTDTTTDISIDEYPDPNEYPVLA